MECKIKKCKDTANVSVYIVISMLAILVFSSIYGIKVLDPTYVDWLLQGGDLSQHYLGWKAYRNCEWFFPIGMVDNLAYPIKTSIIFTDSIPIFAVFFKVLSPILPTEFQYFGIWGVLSFILQGIFAAKIINNFTKNKKIIVLSSIFFLFVPIMLFRMFAHTALAGQWIILYSINSLFYYDKYSEDNKRIYWHVFLMGVLAPLIHIYFVLMCGIILCGICLCDIFHTKKVKHSVSFIVLYLVTVISLVALFGGFSSGTTAEIEGLGKYSFNINSLFNPQGWSCLLPDLSLYGDGQYEGLAYLGMGCILLSIGAVIKLIYILYKKKISCCMGLVCGLIFIVVISSLVAISPVITWGSNVLCTLKIPEVIYKIWSIFRSSGRMIWPVVYVIMMLSIIILVKNGKKITIIILFCCLVIQIYDIHFELQNRYLKFNTKIEYCSVLKNKKFWNSIANNKRIKHIIYTDINFDREYMYSVTDWAMDSGKTVNYFYFARDISDEVVQHINEFVDNVADSNLYIFFDQSKIKCLEYPLHYYCVDDIIVGYTKDVVGYEEMDAIENN